jgi:hypothetical protein
MYDARPPYWARVGDCGYAVNYESKMLSEDHRDIGLLGGYIEAMWGHLSFDDYNEPLLWGALAVRVVRTQLYPYDDDTWEREFHAVLPHVLPEHVGVTQCHKHELVDMANVWLRFYCEPSVAEVPQKVAKCGRRFAPYSTRSEMSA